MSGRAAIDAALCEARTAAFPRGEFVGQESFMSATDIIGLARRAGVVPGAHVLDVCCGCGGPGRSIARRTGCAYLGVDADPEAIRLARRRATTPAWRYVTATVPPLPVGAFDVVLLLETMLAFPDKAPLLDAVVAGLRPGGRFACTLEEGAPLTDAERARMPAADTVWPVPLPEFQDLLAGAGLRITEQRDQTRRQLHTVEALTASFTLRRESIAAAVGEGMIDDLLRAHRLWGEWMGSGRIRKFELVACRA